MNYTVSPATHRCGSSVTPVKLRSRGCPEGGCTYYIKGTSKNRAIRCGDVTTDLGQRKWGTPRGLFPLFFIMNLKNILQY